MTQRYAITESICVEATRGDRAAREHVVRTIGPMVLAMSRRMSPEPEDAFQRVWERVFRALERFDCAGTAKMSTWIATIAHRTLIDGRRSASRRGVAVPLSPNLHAKEQPETQLTRKQSHQQLLRAIDGLPIELRDVLVAHHLGGLSLRHIATELDLKLGTVKSRLHRARAALAETARGAQ